MNEIERLIQKIDYDIDFIDKFGRKKDAKKKKELELLRQAMQEKLERDNQNEFELEELEKIEVFDWVWIEVVDKMEISKSGYYQKNSDWSESERFCCGYPGIMCGFKYCDYGKTWAAYRHKPKTL